MLLPRLQPSIRTVVTSSTGSSSRASTRCLNEAFGRLAVGARSKRVGGGLEFVRYASHAQQGAVNKAKDGPGKRLGAKKSGEQYVIPGNIIFKQRGTLWHAGENCGMGRDHTIYALKHGFVKYYRDPARHKTRRYIGIVFERDQVLPVPEGQPRRRRLNMEAVKIEPDPQLESNVSTDLVVDGDGVSLSTNENMAKVKSTLGKGRKTDVSMYRLRPGGMYREANWEIGRAAERAGIVDKVKKFVPGDRWTAWRKAKIRFEKNKDKRDLARKMSAGKSKAKAGGNRGRAKK